VVSGFAGILLLIAGAIAVVTEMRSRKRDVLIFEEEYEEQLVSLNLG
jgi:hypothetical protein